MEEEKKELEEEKVEEVKEEAEAKEEAKEEKAEEAKEKQEESKAKDFFDTKDETADFDAKDIEENKVMAILAYIGILVLIPLLAAKESKFARYHTNQGFTLFLFGFCSCVVLEILGIIPVVGIVFTILGSLVGLCFFILMILGIVNAAQGFAKELPFIGKYRFLKDDAKEEKEEKKDEE